FVDQQSIIVLWAFLQRRQLQGPYGHTQFQDGVVKLRDFVRSTRRTASAILLHSAGASINRQQPIRELPILRIFRHLQRQLDRLAQQVGPAFLRLGEVRVYRRVVADHDARERRRIEELFERLGVLVHAEEQHASLLRKNGPDAVDAPTGFVGMHHHRVGQERAQHIKLLLPMPGQLPQQRIRLAFAEPKILQELQHLTNLVKGQADDINEVGNLDDDL